MVKNKFKVLTYNSFYVDENKLDKGIYISDVPNLHPEWQTLEGLVSIAEMFKDFRAGYFVEDSYIENLRKCKLITVEILNLTLE